MKNYTDNIKIEDTAYHVMDCFEEILDRRLDEDERDFAMRITKKTFDAYIVENRGDILVAGEEEKEKLDSLLADLVENISTLMVHYIYSRLEAYILFKQLKEETE